MFIVFVNMFIDVFVRKYKYELDLTQACMVAEDVILSLAQKMSCFASWK